MPYKEMTINQIAKNLGIDVLEVSEKHRLIELIKKARREKDISQVMLAKKVGVTQGRIAQIESRMGTSNITFESLFSILRHLGYECKVVAKKAG